MSENIAKGYLFGSYISAAESETQVIKLHYSSKSEAEDAFDAITELVGRMMRHAPESRVDPEKYLSNTRARVLSEAEAMGLIRQPASATLPE